MFNKKFKGYIVDTNKNEEGHPYSEKYYVSSSSNKNSTLLRHGELLSERDLKKLKVSPQVKNKYLVPVSVDQKAVFKSRRGAGSRTTKEVDYFLEKPEILGDYTPNRMNANNYKKRK